MTGKTYSLYLFLHDDDEDDAFLLNEVVNAINQTLPEIDILFTHFLDRMQLMDRLSVIDCYKEKAVLLMDIKMPQEDGVQVLGRIKSNPETRRIPVVMYSSSDSPGDRERSYRNYANGYIVKEDNFNRLSEKISKLVNYYGIANSS